MYTAVNHADEEDIVHEWPSFPNVAILSLTQNVGYFVNAKYLLKKVQNQFLRFYAFQSGWFNHSIDVVVIGLRLKTQITRRFYSTLFLCTKFEMVIFQS